MRNVVALCCAAVLCVPALAADDVPTASGGAITYAKQISRLIQENCQECHRPNSVAPFSLLTYRQVKAWSKMIREVVSDGRMPPWFADAKVGKWANDLSLSAAEKQMFLGWIDAGMPLGAEADLPTPIEYSTDWHIGTPDAVFEIPEEVTIDPTGVVPYKHYMIETDFKEDVYISAMEVKPGNPKVVHHIIMFVQDPKAEGGAKEQFLGIGGGMLDVYAPGSPPGALPEGLVRKIPAGAKLVWQVHYTPTGRTETDRSKFGVIFAKGSVKNVVRTATVINPTFTIPARDPNYKVEADMNFPEAATVYSFTPHMHYRGKSMDFVLTYPDGKSETVCSVPKYDFNWQLDYRLAEPLRVPKGTNLKVVAHFDNSEQNPYNPDPTKPVKWGEQTWEEMMMGGIFMSWDDASYEETKAD